MEVADDFRWSQQSWLLLQGDVTGEHYGWVVFVRMAQIG